MQPFFGNSTRVQIEHASLESQKIVLILPECFNVNADFPVRKDNPHHMIQTVRNGEQYFFSSITGWFLY